MAYSSLIQPLFYHIRILLHSVYTNKVYVRNKREYKREELLAHHNPFYKKSGQRGTPPV